jgi:hypothetical protein
MAYWRHAVSMAGAEEHWDRRKLEVIAIGILRHRTAVEELTLNLVFLVKLESLHSRSTNPEIMG